MKALIVAAVVLLSGQVLYYSCAEYRATHQIFPPIGVPVKLEAVSNANPSKPHSEYANILVYFVLGSRSLQHQENATVSLFAKKGDDLPIYQFTTAELRERYRATNCTGSVLGYLENAMDGDALFCNNALDLSKVTYFEAKLASGKTKTATSYVVDFVRENEDLISITINMD